MTLQNQHAVRQLEDQFTELNDETLLLNRTTAEQIQILNTETQSLNVTTFEHGATLEDHSEQLSQAHRMISDLSQAAGPIIEEYASKRNIIEAQRKKNETDRARLHFEEFSQTDLFLSLGRDQMQEILSSDKVNVTSEIKVYEALLRWIRADETVRVTLLPDLFSQVRLRLIDAQYLMVNISSDPLIENCSTCSSLIYETVILESGQTDRK